MSSSAFIDKTPQAQVKELEKLIAAGDIAGMAGIIESLHGKWDSLSEPMQKDIGELEAIFLSLVKLKIGVS